MCKVSLKDQLESGDTVTFAFLSALAVALLHWRSVVQEHWIKNQVRELPVWVYQSVFDLVCTEWDHQLNPRFRACINVRWRFVSSALLSRWWCTCVNPKPLGEVEAEGAGQASPEGWEGLFRSVLVWFCFRKNYGSLLSLTLMFFFLGVYFDCCVRQIKFVDFCGKYRLPLMHYLCSPECSSPCTSASHSSTSQSESDSEDEASVAAHRMQKVLLGWAAVGLEKY